MNKKQFAKKFVKMVLLYRNANSLYLPCSDKKKLLNP